MIYKFYNSIDEFTMEYNGKRNPSKNQWYGLEFKYNDKYYRYDCCDGFYLFEIIIEGNYPNRKDQILLFESNSNEELLDFKIGDKKLKDIISSDEIQIVGQD